MSNHGDRPTTRPDATWLATWSRDIDAATRALVADFEGRFGYPPGRNSMNAPDPDALVAAHQLAKRQEVAAPLPHFYRHIGEVVLEDVGNAIFIHPASHVLHDLADSGPIPLGEPGPAALFASNGGGILFAIATNGTIHRSSDASRDSDFQLVAEDLQDFLDQLRHAVIRFIRTDEPGDL